VAIDAPATHIGSNINMTTQPDSKTTKRDPIGTVRMATCGGVELPCVKITDTEWIIRNGLKHITFADTKYGSDIFLVEAAP
jgi:hypothetical protein